MSWMLQQPEARVRYGQLEEEVVFKRENTEFGVWDNFLICK